MRLYERAREARMGIDHSIPRNVSSPSFDNRQGSTSASGKDGAAKGDEMLDLRSTIVMSNQSTELDLLSSMVGDIRNTSSFSLAEVFRDTETSFLDVDWSLRTQSVELPSSRTSVSASTPQTSSISELEFCNASMPPGTMNTMFSTPYESTGDTSATSSRPPTATELAAYSDVGPKLVSERFTAAEVHRAALSPIPSRAPGPVTPQPPYPRQFESPEMVDDALWESLLGEFEWKSI